MRTANGPQLMAWSLIVLAIVYLTVLGGGAFAGLYIVELRILSTASVALAVVVWLAIAQGHHLWVPRTKLWPSIAAVLSAFTVSVAASEHPSIGGDYLAYAVLLGCAYLILQRLLAHAYFAPRLGSLAVLLGFSLCAAYIVVVVLRWIEMWSSLGRWVTPPLRPGFEGLLYGNPSAVAAAVVLLWLASAAHLGFSTTARRALVIALGALTALVVLLSGSRGAWVGVATAAALAGPAWLLVRSHRRAVVDLFRPRLVRIGGLLTVIAAGVLAAALLPAVLSRVSEGAAELRSALVAAAWRMFLEDPVTGVGPGMYVVERSAHTLSGDVDFYVAHAHNVFAQTIAEFGLLGVAAGIVIAANVGLLIVRAIRSEDPVRGRFGWAALAGVLYLAVHQLFDFYMNMPALGLMLALTVVRLDAIETDARVPAEARLGRPRAPRWVPAMTTIAILISAALATTWLARSEQVALSARDATNAANHGDWPTALDNARTAVDASPDWPPYLFTLGLAAANLGDLEGARDAFQRSAELDHYPTTWLNVARLELDLGDETAARVAVENAMRLGYQQPQVAIAAASMYVELDDAEGAALAAYNALLGAPGLAGDPYWRSTPGLEAAWSLGLSRAEDRIPDERGFELALEAGRPEVAREILLRLPEASQADLLPVFDAWAGDARAFAAVKARTIVNPLNGHVVARCHRIASRARDDLGLDPTIWQCDRAGYAFDPIVFRVGAPPTARVPLPGPNSSWHFQGAYERFVPFDELVPGLPHLEAV